MSGRFVILAAVQVDRLIPRSSSAAYPEFDGMLKAF
jgi:hypothetical protein